MAQGIHSRPTSPRLARANGFTILELIVVIGLVALLVAILVPALGAARRQARRTACVVNLRATGMALNLYKSQLGRYPYVGDRNPFPYYFTWTRPAVPTVFRARAALNNIADIAEALVYSTLGDPRTMYCPSSVENDFIAPKPFKTLGSQGRQIPLWRLGAISYMYLVGLDYRLPESTFPDEQGQPTFNPETEVPDRLVNRVNTHNVLLGDTCVEPAPGMKNIFGSNHGREGGWFYFTSGEAQWWEWSRLTRHPTTIHIWYWPRTGAARPRNTIQ